MPEQIPDWIKRAEGLPYQKPWSYEDPGDRVSGAFVSSGWTNIADLANPDLERTIPLVCLYGVSFNSQGSSQLGYWTIAGASTVLGRKLTQAIQASQPGQLWRITYLGHQESEKKGHSAYADFDVSVGPREEGLAAELTQNAPALPQTKLQAELQPGEEPF